MGLFDGFDFANGKLPPWLRPLIELTGPAVTALTAAILPVGGFTVGMLAFFWPEGAMQMVDVSTSFFEKIPQAMYQLIGTIVVAYTAGVGVQKVFGKPENMVTSPPDDDRLGAPPTTGSAVHRTSEIDNAPRGKT